MLKVYERSLCQSFASALKQGTVVATAQTREEAQGIVDELTEDCYHCFAVDEDGTCIDVFGTYPGCLAGVEK